MAQESFINRKACRKYLLSVVQTRKGWNAERVSAQILDDLNLLVRNRMYRAVMCHPTGGKTIKYLQ